MFKSEYGTPITVIPGGIASNGTNINSETYLTTRRRIRTARLYINGAVLMCDEEYTMCVYFYSTNNSASYISNSGYVGNKYRLDELENVNYFNVVFKKNDGTSFGETEIPELHYFVENDEISTVFGQIGALCVDKEAENQFVNGGISRTGAPVSASTGKNYLLSTMPVDDDVVSAHTKTGYYLSIFKYDAQGVFDGFLTGKNIFTTDSTKGVYWCSNADFSKLRSLYPNSMFLIEITNLSTATGTSTAITTSEESNLVWTYSKFHSIQSYYANEMAITIDSVRDAITEPALVFPLVTDIHYLSKNNAFDYFIKNLAEFCKNVKCDFVVNLGDNTDGDTTKAITFERNSHMLSAFNGIGVPYLFAIGNHDTNYFSHNPDYLFTSDEIYKSYLSNTHGVFYDMTSGEKNYFKDYDELGIRVIVLDANHNGQYRYSAHTATWLSTVALNTSHIVVLLEHLSSIGTQNWNAQTLTNGGDVTSALTTFVNNGGTLIQLCGHSHADYYFSTPWLAIFSCCQKTAQGDTTTSAFTAITGYEGTIVAPERVLGTPSEDCWSVIVIKPLSRTVESIRFGAGVDRTFTF